MHIKVTQEHIEKGRLSIQNCPITLAILEALHLNPGEVGVLYCGIRIGKKRIRTPASCQRFMKQFDDYDLARRYGYFIPGMLKPDPQEFEIDENDILEE